MLDIYYATFHNSKFRKKNSFILMSFLKKLITDMPSKRLIFKPKQGQILSQRVEEGLSLVTVKDPFIDKFSWTAGFKDSGKMERLLKALWSLFEKAANPESGNLMQVLFLEPLYSF